MLGLIGGGYWGKNLVKTFNNIGVLKTICEINDELIKKYNVDYPHIITVDDYDEMLSDPSITMICVSLPAPLHYEFGIKALKAGKHLYVEKPITLDVQQAMELEEYSRMNNLKCMVGHLLHYHEAIKKIKEILKSNDLGPIKYITSNRKSHGIFRTFENVLWSFAPHDISIALSLCNGTFEDVQSISCNGKSFITENVHDIVNLTMTINNIYVNINVDWSSPYKEQKLSIVCEKGMILFDDVEKNDKLKIIRNHIQTIDNNPVAMKDNFETIYLPSISPLENECRHFVETCDSFLNPITDAREGIEVLKVLKRADEILKGKNIKKSSSMSSDTSVDTYGTIASNENNIWSFKSSNEQPFIHETSICKSKNVGATSKVWHWSHVTDTAIIGENCNIGQSCYIAGTIGNGCKVQNNISIYKGVISGDNVFFGPSCVFTNDINPRCEYSKNGQYMETNIEDGVTIGANATIICGKRLGKYCLIGAGSVVTKDVEPYAIMVGNPARKIGTIDEQGNRTINN